MTKEISQVSTLTDADRSRLFDWGQDIFGANDLNLTWRHKDVHFLLAVDGEIVSCVGVLKHQIRVGGESMMVGGVGGVVTIPTAQRRGYARELMSHAAEFFKRWGVEAGLLFCLKRRVPYYASQGWQLVGDQVEIEQPDGKIQSPLEVMVLPLTRPWPAGKVQLDSFPW